MRRAGVGRLVLALVLCRCSSYDSANDATTNVDAGGGATDAAGTNGFDAGTSDAGSSDAGTDASNIPPGCDPAADPKDAPACISDDFALFVDTNGGNDATGIGTKAAPFRTIGAAVTKAGSRSRIYVCHGTYAEAVRISRRIDLAGGFACGTWSYTGEKAIIAPGAKGYAVQISGANGMQLSDLDVSVVDATDAGESSIAVFIASSKVDVSRLDIRAGVARAGKSALQATLLGPAPKGTGGTNATGGPTVTNSCGAEKSIGGHGANVGENSATAGEPGLGGGVAGKSGAPCASGGAGGSGTAGMGGGNAPVLTSLGDLTVTGWAPAPGAAGSPGKLGQGGGGGGSQEGAGGGGGAGGCGGKGGDGGGGGGASIAILVFDAQVSVRSSVLKTSIAGAGGSGAAGQNGQPFGGGGNGAPGASVDGCPGGEGGKGGSGGAGAGGAGGISAAILYRGAAPTVDPTSALTFAVGGPGGAGGASNDGPHGTSGTIVEAE